MRPRIPAWLNALPAHLPEGMPAVADRPQLTTTAGNPIADNQAGELGAADAERDLSGFALKFYTEGNWDLVGNSSRKS